MSLFQKKTTLIHHITYMGIMAAINLVFILLATYVPFMMLVVILLLPFASAIVSYYCLKRYYLIYALASVGLCMIFNISDTLFYVVPAVMSGFVIGILLEKKIHPFWMILSMSVINASLTYAFMPLIGFIGKSDAITEILIKNEYVLPIVFVVSLFQCFLTVFIMLNDTKKIGIEINTRIDFFAPYIIGLELSITGALGFSFIYFPLSVVFLIITLCFSVMLVMDLLMYKKVYIYILLVIGLFLSILLFALFYTKIAKPNGLLLVIIYPLIIGVISFVKYCLINKKANNKILL